MLNSFLQFKDDKTCLEYISLYKNELPSEVAIKLSKLDADKRTFVLAQIKGLQKGRLKFPEFASKANLLYPPPLSIEQSSSERTGKYKASLFKGKTFVDLTAGFGVDDFYFAPSFEKLVLVEKNQSLSALIKENFKNIYPAKIDVINSSSEEYIQYKLKKVDLIYIDPSRRTSAKKVFKIEDCEPNILEILPRLNELSQSILIKISPMMDLSELYRSVQGISCIYVISVENECKEILLSIEKDKTSDLIHCIELGSHPFNYSFSFESEKHSEARISSIRDYLYLPNVSVSKAGAFNSLCQDFNLKKVSLNTHIYTSNKLLKHFPGNTYKVHLLLQYKKETLHDLTKDRGFNIIKRNFPDDIKVISKKLGIKSSGNNYLIAYRNSENKPAICVCEKINA